MRTHPEYDEDEDYGRSDCTVFFCLLSFSLLLYFPLFFVLKKFPWEKGYWVARNVTLVWIYSSWAIDYSRLKKNTFCWHLKDVFVMIFFLSAFNFMPSTLQLVCISIISVTLLSWAHDPLSLLKLGTSYLVTQIHSHKMV